MNNIDFFKKGYKIYIKPENRGKFTQTKKRTGKTTEELTHSKNPLTRKRAIFAQNAKKWKHQNGGSINPNDLLGIQSNITWKYNPNEAYTDKSNNTIVYNTPESIYHEYYGHMNPDTQLLQKLLPWYNNLSDERLQELGADLQYVKRTEDPGIFYQPEELLGRIQAALRMLPENSNYSSEFFENIRKTEHQYGDNIRDLLHMYNNENLSKIFKTVIQHKSKPKLIKKDRNWNYSKIKTPSNEQQKYFIEFLKQNDSEGVDLAEDLLHGIYPQLPITKKQLEQFIKEGKKEEEHYLWKRRMENSRKESEEFLKKLEEDKKQWEQEEKKCKKLWENSRKYAKEKAKETYQKTDPDSPKYDPKYTQELAIKHGSNLETQKDIYNFFAEQFSPKPITEEIKSAVDRERAKELYEESMENTEKFFDALGAITGVGGITTRFVPNMTQYALPMALTGTMVDATSAIVNPDAENISQAVGGLAQTVGATDAFRRIPGRWGIWVDTASDYIGTVFDLYGIGKPIIKSATKY